MKQKSPLAETLDFSGKCERKIPEEMHDPTRSCVSEI